MTLWQTFVFERLSGSWRLVHVHASVPAPPAREASVRAGVGTHVTIPTLETERLRLRSFRPDDTDAYAAMCADPEFMRYLGSAEPMPWSDAWRQMAMFVGHWHLRGFGMWAVEERARPGVLIGRIGCHQPEGWPDFEVGWALARPYWGRGYATEGARATLSYAFERLGRPRVVSLIAPENQRSIRVAERLGERLTGDAEIAGRRVLVYAIEREAWSGAA
jgi:RimJ/RimL family protein N-acetyltransferase